MTGIYIFKNTKEKKCYIGQSSDLERRKYQHYHSSLKDDFHLDLRENSNDFEYKVLQECLVKELDDLELMWMNWYQNEGWELYNKHNYKKFNQRGKHRSEETRKKISEANKGKLIGENHPMYGKHFHHSKEAKKKISEAGKGREPWNKGKTGPEPWNKGKKASEETRKKMSESHKGIFKGRKQVVDPETGKKHWV